MGRTTGTGTVTQRETASMVCGLAGSSRNSSSGWCGKEVLVYDWAGRLAGCWSGSRLAGSDRAGQSSSRALSSSSSRWPVRKKQNSRAAGANWVGRRLR